MNNYKTAKIEYHEGDLPDGVTFKNSVAVDCEAMGLNVWRDRLCVVQLSSGDGTCHVVRLARGEYDAPNLKAMFTDPNLVKIFHYARYDLVMLRHWLGVVCAPVYCTKIASRLARTYTERHGLKDVVRETLGVELSKEQQSSDWGAHKLTDSQMDYAAIDVLYLHNVRARLDNMLIREERLELAEKCFAFLPTRAELDLAGWPEIDIFAHK